MNGRKIAIVLDDSNGPPSNERASLLESFRSLFSRTQQHNDYFILSPCILCSSVNGTSVVTDSRFNESVFPRVSSFSLQNSFISQMVCLKMLCLSIFKFN